MLDTPPRRRALSEDVAQKRLALTALVPIHRNIGPWQTRAARVVAFAQKLQSTGRHDPGVLAEAEALFFAVSQQKQLLVDTTSQLPPDVAANSRVRDAARALNSLASNLESSLTMLKRC